MEVLNDELSLNLRDVNRRQRSGEKGENPV